MLVLNKRVDETWLECALRYAAPYGLERDVENSFYDALSRGKEVTEGEAAWCACHEWDILDFEPDPYEGREEDNDESS